jgi:hypothetical protein
VRRLGRSCQRREGTGSEGELFTGGRSICRKGVGARGVRTDGGDARVQVVDSPATCALNGRCCTCFWLRRRPGSPRRPSLPDTSNGRFDLDPREPGWPARALRPLGCTRCALPMRQAKAWLDLSGPEALSLLLITAAPDARSAVDSFHGRQRRANRRQPGRYGARLMRGSRRGRETRLGLSSKPRTLSGWRRSTARTARSSAGWRLVATGRRRPWPASMALQVALNGRCRTSSRPRRRPYRLADASSYRTLPIRQDSARSRGRPALPAPKRRRNCQRRENPSIRRDPTRARLHGAKQKPRRKPYLYRSPGYCPRVSRPSLRAVERISPIGGNRSAVEPQDHVIREGADPRLTGPGPTSAVPSGIFLN